MAYENLPKGKGETGMGVETRWPGHPARQSTLNFPQFVFDRSMFGEKFVFTVFICHWIPKNLCSDEFMFQRFYCTCFPVPFPKSYSHC